MAIIKVHVKLVEIYMVKLNGSNLNRLNIMGFFVNAKYIHKSNVILNKTVTKHFNILTKCFFPYLDPVSEKLPPIKLPSGKLPLRNFPSRKFQPGIFPTMFLNISIRVFKFICFFIIVTVIIDVT